MHICVHITICIEIIMDGCMCVSECIPVWKVTHWKVLEPSLFLSPIPHIFLFSKFCFGKRYCMGDLIISILCWLKLLSFFKIDSYVKTMKLKMWFSCFFLKQWDCVGHGFLLTKKGKSLVFIPHNCLNKNDPNVMSGVFD